MFLIEGNLFLRRYYEIHACFESQPVSAGNCFESADDVLKSCSCIVFILYFKKERESGCRAVSDELTLLEFSENDKNHLTKECFCLFHGMAEHEVSVSDEYKIDDCISLMSVLSLAEDILRCHSIPKPVVTFDDIVSVKPPSEFTVRGKIHDDADYHEDKYEESYYHCDDNAGCKICVIFYFNGEYGFDHEDLR